MMPVNSTLFSLSLRERVGVRGNPVLLPKGEGTLMQLYTLFTRFLNNRVALFFLSDWAVPTAKEPIPLFYRLLDNALVIHSDLAGGFGH